MEFTEEMINEDEKRWHARNVIKELVYCGNYMRDRKDMTNLNIRFYAYIMRKAHSLLKEQEPVRCKDCAYAIFKEGLVQHGHIVCTKPYTEHWQHVKPDNWFCADGKRSETDD